MVVTIDNPKGLDFMISRLQLWLQNAIFPQWGLDAEIEDQNAQYMFYPRIYRNQVQGHGYIAELYTGNKEYREVYWNDNLTGLSWFGTGARDKWEGGEQVADVHLVTFANIQKLYGDSHRFDNEIRMAFQRLFQTPIFGFTLVSTETGLQNVLREYPGSRRDDRLAAVDMGFIHAFRLNLQLKFNPETAC